MDWHMPKWLMSLSLCFSIYSRFFYFLKREILRAIFWNSIQFLHRYIIDDQVWVFRSICLRFSFQIIALPRVFWHKRLVYVHHKSFIKHHKVRVMSVSKRHWYSLQKEKNTFFRMKKRNRHFQFYFWCFKWSGVSDFGDSDFRDSTVMYSSVI